MALRLDPRIDIGHVLTMASVLVSVIALLVSWDKDRELQERAQADEVRTAAAETLAPLERWGAFSSFLYREIDPAFVRAGEMLQEGTSRDRIRDEVLRLANTSRARLLWLRLEADLGSSFSKLYSFHPEIRGAIEALLGHLGKQEDQIFGEFLDELERAILMSGVGSGPMSAADFRSGLADIGHRYHQCSLRLSKGDLEPIAGELTKMVQKSDLEILAERGDRRRLVTAFAQIEAERRSTEVGERLCRRAESSAGD